MKLDFPTLNLYMIVLLASAALVFALVASRHRRRPGLWWWLAGCILIGLGYGLRWWHSTAVPSEAFWWSGALYIAGNIAFWIGVYRFTGIRQRLQPRHVALLLLGCWLAASQLSYPDQLALSLLLSALPNLLVAALLRRAQHLAEAFLRLAVSAVFLATALVLLARAVMMLIADRQDWLISTEQLSALTALPSAALIMLRCFALLVLLHAQQEQELRQLAVTDALTGVLNRKGFFELAQRLLERQPAAEHPVAVLMMDLDHFKRINDQHGHAAGDAVLRRFANLLREQLRPGDCTGRLGGEEFAALLPGVDAAGAQQIAERLRRHLCEQAVATDAGLLNVTVSIGVHASQQVPVQIEALLQQADRSLYEAKAGGRNRVMG